jgi:adenylate cyclase
VTTTRRLAAILAADVAGYSRLIGTDEQGTLNHCDRPLPLAVRDSPARIASCRPHAVGAALDSHLEVRGSLKRMLSF